MVAYATCKKIGCNNGTKPGSQGGPETMTWAQDASVASEEVDEASICYACEDAGRDLG